MSRTSDLRKPSDVQRVLEKLPEDLRDALLQAVVVDLRLPEEALLKKGWAWNFVQTAAIHYYAERLQDEHPSYTKTDALNRACDLLAFSRSGYLGRVEWKDKDDE